MENLISAQMIYFLEQDNTRVSHLQFVSLTPFYHLVQIILDAYPDSVLARAQTVDLIIGILHGVPLRLRRKILASISKEIATSSAPEIYFLDVQCIIETKSRCREMVYPAANALYCCNPSDIQIFLLRLSQFLHCYQIEITFFYQRH